MPSFPIIGWPSWEPPAPSEGPPGPPGPAGAAGPTGRRGYGTALQAVYEFVGSDPSPEAGALSIEVADPVWDSTWARLAFLDDDSASRVTEIIGMADSTNPVKGTLRIEAITDPSRWATFDLTDVAPNNVDHYCSLDVENGNAWDGSAFTVGERVAVTFSRAGDKGDGSAVPDASGSTKGIMKLAGDLGGTADLPTVPGLASKLGPASGTPDGTKFLRDDLAWETPAGGGGAGLWQELDRVSVPVASPLPLVSLTVPAGDWMQLRVRYIGACTTYTLGARLLALNVNNQPSGIWEGDGLFHSKGFQVTPGSTWSLNISGAGNAHTGTSAPTSIPVGAIYPDSWHGRSHGEVTITQDDKLTSVYAVARNNTAANGTFQVYNNGYAVYTSPITSVQLAAYSMAGLFILEGRAAQPTILPLDPGTLNTDPAFTNNSDVQVPTQRAVRAALDRQPFALMPPTRFGAGSFLGTRLTGIKSGATCSVTESRSALGMTTLRRGTIQELAVNILTALPAGQKGDICCYSVDGSGFPALLQWTQQIPLDTTGDVAVTGLNLPIPNTGKWAFALWSRPGNGGPVILTGADAGTELGTQTYSGATMSYQLRPSNGILPPDLTSWPAQGGSGINVLGGFSVAPMILARGVSA